MVTSFRPIACLTVAAWLTCGSRTRGGGTGVGAVAGCCASRNGALAANAKARNAFREVRIIVNSSIFGLRRVQGRRPCPRDFPWSGYFVALLAVEPGAGEHG